MSSKLWLLGYEVQTEFLDFDYQFYRIKTLLGRKIDALAKDVAKFYIDKIAEGYKSNNKWPVSKNRVNC